jgi:hypothetical protein
MKLVHIRKEENRPAIFRLQLPMVVIILAQKENHTPDASKFGVPSTERKTRTSSKKDYAPPTEGMQFQQW